MSVLLGSSMNSIFKVLLRPWILNLSVLMLNIVEYFNTVNKRFGGTSKDEIMS